MYGIGGERELERARRSTTSTATRARRRCASATARTRTASTTCGGRSSTRSTCTPSRATGCPTASGRSSSKQVEEAITPLARARPRHLGGARRAQALHLVEDHVLGRVRPRRAAGRGCAATPRASCAGRRRPTRSTPTCSPTASTTAACSSSTTTPTRSTRRCCSRRSCASCRPTTSAIVNTVNAIADELTVDGLVLRYRVEETDDGLRGEEGTFAICSFWLVSALAEIGETRRARELCEKLLGYASSLGLFAEEIDARSGRHLGNFPQAFTHLALINAVMHVIRADHELAAQAPAARRAPARARCRRWSRARGPARMTRVTVLPDAEARRPARRRRHGQPDQRRAQAQRRRAHRAGRRLDAAARVRAARRHAGHVVARAPVAQRRALRARRPRGRQPADGRREPRLEAPRRRTARRCTASAATSCPRTPRGSTAPDIVRAIGERPGVRPRPARPRARRAHRVAVPRPRRGAARWPRRSSRCATRPSRRPSGSSFTLPLIARARYTLLLATGEGKREALARVRAGDPELPAARLGEGLDEILCDEAAAG